jgi:UDP-N-acetylglucosamine 2-epimerase
MKIISVVGARPEFIQAAPLRRLLQKSPRHRELWIHTGQHYDYQMSQAFFDDLGLPSPEYNLEVGSGSHGQQTGAILAKIEEVLLAEKPDCVVVRGDTNSTIAGALAAVKLQIPLAHIEAGERSYDRRMPEEINRLVTDRISNIHFCSSQSAVRRLMQEGIEESIYWVGDVMYDALLQHLPLARAKSTILQEVGLSPKGYALVTIHRAANTDSPQQLGAIVDTLNQIPETIVFPAHPRTRAALERYQLKLADHIRVIPPVGYFDMMVLEENARLIATDSGGVQREAYFLSIPCLTLRDTTEWGETVEVGWNRLVGADTDEILDAWFSFSPPSEHPAIFGHGIAAQQILSALECRFGRSYAHTLSSKWATPSVALEAARPLSQLATGI